MTAMRAALILAIIVGLAMTPAIVRLGGLTQSASLKAYAATMAAPRHPEKDDNRKFGDNGNDNNRDNDNNGNGNSNDNGNENDDGGSGPPPPPRQAAPAPSPACSTPGQEMTFTSPDGRVSVRVFASMTKALRITIRKPVDPASVQPVPGQRVDDLLFQITAEACDGGPISTLPAEVNLGVHYTDGEVGSLNEASFKLSQLDTSANQWRAVQKQAIDPPANYISASITDLGYYVVHQP